MRISGMEANRQNYTSGKSDAKSSDYADTFKSFQEELVNWEQREKEARDKQRENDNSGNIMMSDKQWRSIIKKVDKAIDAVKEDQKEREKVKQKEQIEKKRHTHQLILE